MTIPKIKTVKLGYDGPRFYVNPLTEVKAPGVTSILDMLPKRFLKPWGEKLVAQAAVQEFQDPESFFPAFANQDPEGAVEYLKKAPWRVTREAANQGTRAHSIAENIMLGTPLSLFDDFDHAIAAQIEDLLVSVDLTPVLLERTVWSDTHKYAGTFDGKGIIEDIPVWFDWKSNKKGIYPETALQLAAYAHAESILHEDGTQTPNVYYGEERGMIFHIRPEHWSIYEVPITEDVFAYFLALRQIFDWDANSKTVLGRPIVEGKAAEVFAHGAA